MEINNDEFNALRIRVDQVSSELDKQNTVRAVNTKWMVIVGTIILAALGFTSFVQLPREAARAAREQVGPEIMNEAKKILSDLQRTADDAGGIKKELGEITELQKIANLPIGTIIPSMLDPISFAEAVGDTPEKTKWVPADGRLVAATSRYGQLCNKSANKTSDEIKTPDLRGMFLRGMEEGRTAGDYQADALQQHGHYTDARTLGWGKEGNDTQGYTTRAGEAPQASVTTVIGNARTADETRPKNVAVYFYIKIN